MSTSETQKASAVPASSLSALHSRRASRSDVTVTHTHTSADASSVSANVAGVAPVSISSTHESMLHTIHNMLQSITSRLDKVEATQQSGGAVHTISGAEAKGPELVASTNTNANSSANTNGLGRAQRVMAAAQVANTGALGIPDDQMSLINKFMANEEDMEDDLLDENKGQKVNPYLSSSLFPLRYDESAPLEDALKQALASRSRTSRRFGTFDKMIDAFDEQFDKCIQADGGKYGATSKAWRSYELYIIKLFATKGFDMAQDYHFRLFDLVSRGKHDLVRDGHFCAEVMYDITGAPRKVGGRQGQSFRSPISHPCSFHGPSARHTTAECRAARSTTGGTVGNKSSATTAGTK